MSKWLVLPMVVLAYLAATVSASAPRDRDHDRLPDRWERKQNLSPTTPSAKRDPDSDHLSNRRELRLRTHPRRADTDRDRLRDGAEVRRFHTSPRKRDTDGDGFRDRCELRKGTNPRKRTSHPERRCSKSPQVPQGPPRRLALPPPDPGPMSCEPSAVPGAVAGQGYSQRFADCFDTLDRSVWCPNQWWESAPRAGTQFVRDGVLHLLRRRADGFPNTTISTEPCGQANPKSFRQGYFEARMRWPGVRGAGPAFWLFSTRHATNPDWPSINSACANNGEPTAQCLTSELDVFEGYGFAPNVFTGTLHRNSSGQYGQGNQFNTNNLWQPQSFRVADSWRTYAALWTQSEVRWYLDGVFSHSTPAWDSTNQPMHLILSHWNTPWESGNMPDGSTPDVMDVEVDWVRVWQQ